MVKRAAPKALTQEQKDERKRAAHYHINAMPDIKYFRICVPELQVPSALRPVQ